MQSIKLIINADDLGASQTVNDYTFQLMEQGFVTSATLLANAPRVSEACIRTRDFPECSFGVHLNITEYAPLTDPGALSILLDEGGEFSGEKWLRSVKIDSDLSSAIYLEFESQIEKLMSFGVTVDHIDSHHHVHNIPAIFPVLKKIQKRFQIRRVRISRNLYGVDESVSVSLKAKKFLYNQLLRYLYLTKTTAGFSDFLLFYENAKMGRIKHRVVEAMVHPGNPFYSEDEVNLVASDWQDALKLNCLLINYKEFS